MPHFPENKDTHDAGVPAPGAKVVDADGRLARIASIHADAQEVKALIRLDQGQQVMLPADVLSLQPDGAYRLPFAFGQLAPERTQQTETIPVLQEELQIGKRLVDTGRGVRIHKTVTSREQVVDLPLMRDELRIEHVPVEQIVSGADVPTARYDGETLIVPVFEEVLVVQKQLRLKEEVRITRHRCEVHAPQTVAVKEEGVSIEHFDERSDARTKTDGGE